MDVERLFRCLDDSTRRRILLFLGKDERCVCEIVEHLDRDQSLTSHHLKRLRECGLVQSRRDGKRIMYRVTDPSLIVLLRDAEHVTGTIDGICRCVECDKD